MKGKSGPGLLDSFNLERQPVGATIVTRANDGLRDHVPVWEALGMLDPSLKVRQKHFAELSDATPEGVAHQNNWRAV